MNADLTNVKKMIIERCKLEIEPEELSDEADLFDEEGLALDSLDVFELSNGLEQNYGFPVNEKQDELSSILKTPKSIYPGLFIEFQKSSAIP